jgi:hypothetical protein
MIEPPHEPVNTAELLRTLFEATATETGDDFFHALAGQLAAALEVRQTFVAELIEGSDDARTLTFRSYPYTSRSSIRCS